MKKFFSLVLALVMALSLTTIAWGALTAGTLPAAVNGEIKLTEDVTFSGQNAADQLSGYVIDLNGKTMTLSGNTYLTGETTIKNGNIVVSGYVSDSYLCLYTADTKLTLDTVKLTGTFDAYAVLNGAEGSTLIIKNSVIDVKGNVSQPDIMGNIIYGGNVTVDNSTIKGEDTVRGIGFSNITIQNDSTVEISDVETGFNCATVTVDDSDVTITNATKRAVRLNNDTLTLQGGATLTATNCAEDIVGIGTTDTVSVSSDSTLDAVDDVSVAKVDGVGYPTLQAAIDAAGNGDTVTLLADCAENVTVVQAPNVAITIDGANNTFSGTITVNGKSQAYATAGLTIQNVKFNAVGISKDACINLGGSNTTRYVSNLTVTNCTFTGDYPTSSKVGIKSYTGGDKNITITNCDAIAMHSLAQIYSSAGLTVSDCSVTASKNGVGLGGSSNVTITNCEIDVAGYGIRADADNSGSATITDCEIEAFIPVVVRDASKDYNLSFSGTNTMTAENTDGIWCAVGTSEYETNGSLPTASTADVVVTLNDSSLSSTGVYGNVPTVAQVGNQAYKTLAEAVAAAPDGGTVKLLADNSENVTVGKALTFDFNGYTYSGFVTPATGYTYMDGVVKKTPAASGTTSTGSVTSGTVTPVKAKMYRLAAAGGSMTELNIKVEKIELTTVTGKLVNDVPVYVPDIYKVNNTYYVEVAKADATYALKNNGAYVYLAPAGNAADVNAVIAKFATTVVLDQYVAAAEDVECGDAVKGTKGAAIYKSGTDAYYADGSNWAYFKGEFVTYDKNTKVAYKEHKWDAKSIIVKSTDVKGTKVPVTIECEDCEKTFSIVPSAKFDNTWVKGVNYTTDTAVDKYNTAAVKYYIVLENATYTGTYVPSAPSTDKVTSADTFDAGIAMYVGMSVLAATGSVVVLKKRED